MGAEVSAEISFGGRGPLAEQLRRGSWRAHAKDFRSLERPDEAEKAV